MEREGLKQISDTGALERVIEEVIASNPKQVEQYRGGKTTVINFLVGQAMRATRGQANVTVITELFKRKLGVAKHVEGRRSGSRIQLQRTRRDSAVRLKGKRVVLYFYPKADTPGCTLESCEFRDHAGEFEKKGAAVVGISPDKPAAQAKFKTKYNLPFVLLVRRGEGGRAGLRRLERKDDVRQESHGHRTQHVRDRAGRKDREDLHQGESRRGTRQKSWKIFSRVAGSLCAIS